MISGQTRIRDRSTGKVKTISWTKDAGKPGGGISAPSASAHEKEVLKQEADRARREFDMLSAAEKAPQRGGRFVDGHYVADASPRPEASRPQFEQPNLDSKGARTPVESKQPSVRNEGDGHKQSQGERRDDKIPSNRPERDRVPLPSRERDPYGSERPQYPPGESADRDVAIINAGRGDGVGDFLLKMHDVYYLFRSGGAFDYKHKKNYGRDYQDLGNYNYGKVLRKLGLPPELILRSAGVYQKYFTPKTYSPEFGSPFDLSPRSSYGDDPRDQNQIRMGIEDADKEAAASERLRKKQTHPDDPDPAPLRLR